MKGPKISVMIHTASYDTFISNMGIESYFSSFLENLAIQTFKDFEFIYVDSWFDENRKNFEDKIKEYDFTIKHVPVHEGHRYWYDMGHTYISAAKNTGILYADGELCITFDDSEFIPKDLLQSYWDYYQEGYLLLPLHKRVLKIFTLDPLVYIESREKSDMDSRGSFIREDPDPTGNPGTVYEKDTLFHNGGGWAYAGTPFPLEDAIYLNGFNEKMDGCKSLEDVEFAMRLALIHVNGKLSSTEMSDLTVDQISDLVLNLQGAKKRFVLDKNRFLLILKHQCYNGSMEPYFHDKAIDFPKREITDFIAVENYGLCMAVTQQMYDVIANKNPISDYHLRIIQEHTLEYRKFDPLAFDNRENLEIWLNTPTFDLKQERKKLRKSADWRW